MVEFLNKDKAYAEIVQIVINAGSKLVLISPYIKLPADFLERLKYRDKQGFQTVVVCREKDLNDETKSNLKQLKYLDLRFDDVLHAKCFHNEKSMVITSLNLHEHSQQNNREMGILLSSEADLKVFKEALNEAEFIVDRAKKDSTIKNLASRIMKEVKSVIDSPVENSSRGVKGTSRDKQTGYCIRCGKSIPYDLKSPYCSRCYRVWSKFKDSNYEEEYCHKCGTPNEATTMKRPLCDSCYGKSRS